MKRCVHHWLCEEPAGVESKAVCAKCGAEREFANSIRPEKNPWRGPKEKRRKGK